MREVVGAVDSSRAVVDRARLLIQAGRAKDAMPLLYQAIAADPEDGEPRSLLAYALYHQGEWRAALKAAEEASVCNPLDEWCHRMRALALLEVKQNGKALQAAHEAVRLDPRGRSSLKVLARCQLVNGKRREARQTAGLLLELAPDWADTHEMLGYVALMERRWKDAEQHYRDALQRNPQSWNAMNDLALTMQRQGRHKEAVEMFHQAARLNPSEPLARQNLMSSVQGYIGGGFLVLWMTLQVVRYGLGTTKTLPPEYQPWVLVGLGLVVVAAVAGPIWYRRQKLAEFHPTILTFYDEQSRRARRRTWEQLGVVGGLAAGSFICIIWATCAWAFGDARMGMQGTGLAVFILIAVATVVGFGAAFRYRKELAARWDPNK